MRMVWTCINLELAVHGTTQRVLRQHAFDAGFDDTLRMRIHGLTQGFRLHVADVTGKTVIHLVLKLFAGHGDFVGVDYNEVIAISTCGV